MQIQGFFCIKGDAEPVVASLHRPSKKWDLVRQSGQATVSTAALCKPCLTVRNDIWLHLPVVGNDILYQTGKKRTSKGASKFWLPLVFCSCCYKLFTRLQLVFIEAVAFQSEAFAKHFCISIPALLLRGWPVCSIAEIAMCISNSFTSQEMT